MTKIEIKTRWGDIIFTHEKENNTVKDTLQEAVKSGADLYGADLRGATSMAQTSVAQTSMAQTSVKNGVNLRRIQIYSLPVRWVQGTDIRPFFTPIKASLCGADVLAEH